MLTVYSKTYIPIRYIRCSIVNVDMQMYLLLCIIKMFQKGRHSNHYFQSYQGYGNTKTLRIARSESSADIYWLLWF